MNILKAYTCVLIITVLSFGCKNKDAAGNDLSKIIGQRDSLIDLCTKKDSSINTFISSFAEIENNLVSIKHKEEALVHHTKGNAELRGTNKNKINENIRVINDLTDQNRRKIISLNAQLKNADYTIAELDGLIDILVTNINHKNRDLQSLNKALQTADNRLTQLNAEMIDLSGKEGLERDTLNDMNARHNTAYYIAEDMAYLRDDSIVHEKGGFLSPNQHAELNPDFNTSLFKKIDMNKKASIRVVSKNPKVLSPHPSDSYKIEHKFNNTQTNIVIIDPTRFWSETKYLVVATD